MGKKILFTPAFLKHFTLLKVSYYTEKKKRFIIWKSSSPGILTNVHTRLWVWQRSYFNLVCVSLIDT